jgi:hypothetical protein
MTASQHRTIAQINAQLDSDRAAAELNSRPALTLKEQAQSLAVAMLAAKDAGDLARARELATELRPLLSYLD